MRKFNASEYNRAKYKSYLVRVDREKDKAVIDRMEAVNNISAYVRGLVYGDLVREDHNGEETESV